eukprot:12087367-Alexandrium_andersonii.AAC.1
MTSGGRWATSLSCSLTRNGSSSSSADWDSRSTEALLGRPGRGPREHGGRCPRARVSGVGGRRAA